jgi:hypothetical protein
LQRKCTCDATPEPTGECESCRQKKLQRRAKNQPAPSINPRASSVSEVAPIVHEVLRSSGQPLDAQTRAFMEPRFGHDFSHVRVHTDVSAAESAGAVDALAYTTGHQLVFATGHYAPHTIAGRRLLAHELTHVIQQSRMPVQELGGVHRYEEEANVAADRLTNGEASVNLLSLPKFTGHNDHHAEPSVNWADRGRGRPVPQRQVNTRPQSPAEQAQNFGQATSDVTRTLISDLSSPIVLGSKPRYRVIQHGAEFHSANTTIVFRWVVRDRATNKTVHEISTATIPEAEIPASVIGQLTVEVQIFELPPGRLFLPAVENKSFVIATLSLEQDVVAEDPFLTKSLESTPSPEGMRELVNDFKSYTISSANSTVCSVRDKH